MSLTNPYCLPSEQEFWYKQVYKRKMRWRMSTIRDNAE